MAELPKPEGRNGYPDTQAQSTNQDEPKETHTIHIVKMTKVKDREFYR